MIWGCWPYNIIWWWLLMLLLTLYTSGRSCNLRPPLIILVIISAILPLLKRWFRKYFALYTMCVLLNLVTRGSLCYSLWYNTPSEEMIMKEVCCIKVVVKLLMMSGILLPLNNSLSRVMFRCSWYRRPLGILSETNCIPMLINKCWCVVTWSCIHAMIISFFNLIHMLKLWLTEYYKPVRCCCCNCWRSPIVVATVENVLSNTMWYCDIPVSGFNTNVTFLLCTDDIPMYTHLWDLWFPFQWLISILKVCMCCTWTVFMDVAYSIAIIQNWLSAILCL